MRRARRQLGLVKFPNAGIGFVGERHVSIGTKYDDRRIEIVHNVGIGVNKALVICGDFFPCGGILGVANAEFALTARDFNDIERSREKIIARTTERNAEFGRLELSDGRVIDYAKVPLPDGNNLYSYLNVTDSVQIERALPKTAIAWCKFASVFYQTVAYCVDCRRHIRLAGC